MIFADECLVSERAVNGLKERNSLCVVRMKSGLIYDVIVRVFSRGFANRDR